MSRIFSLIFFNDSEVKRLLDGLIFALNPVEKIPAHITIRGPYERHEDIDQLKQTLAGEEIAVLGLGSFFSSGRGTIFLHCGSDLIKKHWHKPDGFFTPHITLYDGELDEFAEKAFGILSKHRFFFKLKAGDIREYQSTKGQKSFDL